MVRLARLDSTPFHSFSLFASGDVELLVSVVDPLPLHALEPLGREHVRWVALECKEPLLKRPVSRHISTFRRHFDEISLTFH